MRFHVVANTKVVDKRSVDVKRLELAAARNSVETP